jgi:hypothetical protein
LSTLLWLLLAFLNLALSVTLAFTALREGRIGVHRIGIGFPRAWIVVAEMGPRPQGAFSGRPAEQRIRPGVNRWQPR